MSALKLSITSWGEVALDKRGLKSLMRSAGGDIARKDKRLIDSSAGSGRLYRGGGGSAYRGAYRPGPYQASAPGDPPVQVSGSLRNSVRTYVYPNGEGFAVRERQFYALFLEAGARGGGNATGGRRSTTASRAQARRHRARGVFTARVLQPRPHLDRIMQAEAANLDRRVRKALDEGVTWRATRT
jgi:hypothetical protein